MSNLGFGKDRLYLNQDRGILSVDLPGLQEARWTGPRSGAMWVLASGMLGSLREPPDTRMGFEGDPGIFMDFRHFGVASPAVTLPTVPGIASPDGHWFARSLPGLPGVASFRPVLKSLAFSPDSRGLLIRGKESVQLLDLDTGSRLTLEVRR